MKKLAVIEDLNTRKYALPLAHALGKDYITYYCSDKEITSPSLAIQRLIEAGIEVFPISSLKERKVEHSYALADSWFLRVMEQDPQKKNLKNLCSDFSYICYIHSSDAKLLLEKRKFLLYSSQWQLRSSLQSSTAKIIECNNEKSPTWLKMHNESEGLVAGYYHLGEVAANIKKSKAESRKLFEAHVGASLNPDLPVIAYYENIHTDKQEMEELLITLSKKANIIYKRFHHSIPNLENRKNFFIVKEWDNSIIRTAADFVLVLATSGVLFSNFALGIPTIPIYTNKMVPSALDLNPRTLYKVVNRAINSIFDHIPLFNAKDIKGIQKHMQNKTYWNNYHKTHAKIAHEFFGTYYVHDAAERTAKHIKNLLMYDTFKLQDSTFKLQDSTFIPSTDKKMQNQIINLSNQLSQARAKPSSLTALKNILLQPLLKKRAFGNCNAGDLFEAEKIAQSVIHNNPYMSWGYYILGKVQFEQGKYKLAIESIQKAIDIDPYITYYHTYMRSIQRKI